MQPNYPQQPPQYSSDYLDQISKPTAVKTLNPLVLWGAIAGVLLIAVFGIILMSSHTSGPSTSSLTAVATKLSSLQKVSEDAQKNVQSSELKTLNSSLTLALTNANRDIEGPLAAKKIKSKELQKNKAAKQVVADIDAMTARLEDARLNAVYDRTYAREMTYALKTLRSDMAILYKSSGKNLKSVLADTDRNLKPLVDSFSSFNAD